MQHVFARRFAPLVVCLALCCPRRARSPPASPPRSAETRRTAANGAGVLSADGRFVAFESEASNLVTGDTNDSTDVFVRDLLTMTTTRVSVANDGLERLGNSGASGDDRSTSAATVSSTSAATAATWCSCRGPRSRPATRPPADAPGRDRQLPRHLPARSHRRHQTTRVSAAPGGGSADGASHHPKISGDGRWIVFESEATNLVAGDTNGVTDVFLFDRMTGTISRRQRVALGRASGRSGRASRRTSATTATSSRSSRRPPCSAPIPIRCPARARRRRACGPFLVDRQAGTTRRVPAPSIVTSRVVNTPGGPSRRSRIASRRARCSSRPTAPASP